MNRIKDIIKFFIPEKLRPGIKEFFLKIYFIGNKYYCPVCKSSTRIQKPLGLDFEVIKEKQIIGGGFRNALCPVCNSSDRIRLLYLFLKNKTGLYTEKTKLLHFAPEPSLQNIIKKHNNITYLTADLYQQNVMQKIDITNIQYPENTFDAIICNHVLEHIPDDKKAMRELFRVLKPGGWAILQVPISKVLETTYEDFSVTTSMEREKYFGQKDHVRIYGKDYTERLKRAGFKVTSYSWVDDKEIDNKNNRMNLNKEEQVFYCIK